MRPGSGSFSQNQRYTQSIECLQGRAVCLSVARRQQTWRYWVGDNLLAVIVGASRLLAPRSAADRPARLKSAWLENLTTIPTSPLDHTAFVALNGCGEGFRTLYSVDTTSPPMSRFNNKTGKNAFSSCADPPGLALASSRGLVFFLTVEAESQSS